MSIDEERMSVHTARNQSYLFEPPELTPWKSEAVCVSTPMEMWFPSRGESVKRARRMCEGCPVRLECLEYGLWEEFGIWGGTSENERRAIRRRRKGAA